MKLSLKITITLLLLLISGRCYSVWTNSLVNYSRDDYNAGSQNWQIMQHNNSWMYFANKMGVLEFTGKDWNLYRFNNQSEGRTFLKSARSDRIYIAGVNEFGYLTPNETGRLEYNCIISDAIDNSVRFGNIWRIYEADNIVYFCADNSVIKLIDEKITTIDSPDKIDCSAVIDNTLYIGSNSGIYVLAGETFYNLPQSECLKNQKLREILPFKDKILIATALNGLFLMDETCIVPFQTEVDDFIQHNELFSIAVSDEKIAIGTILKGVVIVSCTGKTLNYFNESHGLHNNTVLSIYFDRNNNLWLGLDNGISFINLKSPVTNLYLSPNFYGTGYAAALHENKLYLGTNQGLYYVDFPVPISVTATKLKLVENMQGQVWGLKQVGDELICCLDRGLFTIKNQRMKSLDIKTGVWKFDPTMQDKNKAWVSTYNGFYVMERKDGKWQNPVHIPEFIGSAINFEEGDEGVLFIRSNWNEILRITLNDSLNKVKETKLFNAPSIPLHAYIHKTQEGIKLCSPEGIFKYNSTKESFEPDENLNLMLSKGKDLFYRCLAENNNALWALGDNTVGVHLKNNGKTFIYTHDITLVSNFENIFPVDDTSVIIPNENGFALWNVNKTQSVEDESILQIIHAKTTKPSDSLIYVNSFTSNKRLPEIAYKHNSLSFYFNRLDFGSKQNVFYRCKMDNNPWSDYSPSNTKDYSGLEAGMHTFRVETQLNDGGIVYDEFSFIILPPWYQTKWAYVGYCVFLIIILYSVWYWDDARIKRKKIQIIQKERQNMAAKEEMYRIESEKKEQEIIQLKNEQLEMEVKHKNQELANVAINLSRKNEILLNIKDELMKLSRFVGKEDTDKGNIKRNIVRINNKIDENIILDDSFTRFEKHFDLVHNNFIRSLSNKYPSLTLNERKMCAFIKMQLSSKEIAPLLNISVRGVETLRYRLRKKFNLEREESLTAFLTNFEIKK